MITNLISFLFKNFCAPLLMTFFLLEVVGLFIFDSRYYWDLRYFYFSQNAVVNDTLEKSNLPFWRYKENSTIRTVAVYSDFTGSKVEYDCKFLTNKFGYIDTGSIDDSVDYLVLGDSFTEGHGGCPWLTKATLNNDPVLSKYKILNGALLGNGVQDFERTLTYFNQKVDIKNVVVIVISNDFKRAVGHQWDVEGECYLKLSCGREDYWHFKPIDFTQENFKKDAFERRKSGSINFKREFLRYSFTYFVYQKISVLFSKPKVSTAPNTKPLYEVNFKALQRIHKNYENMKVILVPQRDEVGLLGRENLDTILVKEFFETENIVYMTCQLDASDYMSIDGHPNSKGYKKLFTCLNKTISG